MNDIILDLVQSAIFLRVANISVRGMCPHCYARAGKEQAHNREKNQIQFQNRIDMEKLLSHHSWGFLYRSATIPLTNSFFHRKDLSSNTQLTLLSY